MRAWIWAGVLAISMVPLDRRGGAQAAPQLPEQPASGPELAAVAFLEQAPTIDGRLDDALRHLAPRTFPLVLRQPETNPTPEAHYRLAYGAGFFYVYVEAAADSLTFRDRAYQNGDGFHMVIACPQPDDAPTDEFYVLACSAVRDARMEWSRRVFWYYNVEHLFVRTSDAARLEFAAGEGRISFELLLPWADVHPWHPWLSEAVGFNLAFVKAMPEGKNTYLVAPDGRIDSEQSPRRYTRLSFAPATIAGHPQAFVRLDRGHASAGERIAGMATIAADPATPRSPDATTPGGGAPAKARISLRVLAGEGSPVATQSLEVTIGQGTTAQAFELETATLPPGGYKVQWRLEGGASSGEMALTILPRASAGELLQRLDAAAAAARATAPPSPASVLTMRFLLEEAEQQLQRTRPYETCAVVRIGLERSEAAVEALEAGTDPIAAQRGLFRRAFRSDLDGSLQPYAVLVPDDYDAGRPRPLLVFLHGSGTDERALDSFRALVPSGWLAVAPRARGTSHAYTTPEAQRDIAEVLEDVQQQYAIDPARVVLAGFSMGGYGVLRTQFEHPGRFRALVVVSGHPAIASRFGFGDDQPDFLDPARLKSFRGLPVFVTHGQADRNCPYELATQLVQALRGAGAVVEFASDPVRGHEAPSTETLARLQTWLAAITTGD